MTGSERSVDDRTVSRLSIVYACGAAALLAATWRLWNGQSEFPQAPMFGFAVSIPRSFDGALLATMTAALVAACFVRTRRAAWLIFAAAWGTSAVLDQHRVQVWAWHIVLCGLIIATSAPRDVVRRLRWLTIGIYGWSAFSRADFAFVDGLGSQIAQGLVASIGIERVSPEAARAISMGFPVGEALTAILLASSRTRRFGLISSFVMHGCLLAALGPTGLGHEWGVLLWNALFVVQNVLLFRGSAVDVTPWLHVAGDERPVRWIGNSILIIALVLPAFQSFGLWDVWPSWAVYSARGGWTTVSIHADDVDLLPAGVKPFVLPPAPLSDWQAIDVDEWSRSTLACPANPDARFRFAVAAAIAPQGRLRVARSWPPGRWTGESKRKEWEFSAQLPREIESQFWLNVEPRQARP